MPTFSFRNELRKSHFDPTCIAWISVETIDKSINKTRIIGYAAINLFMDRNSKE